MGVQPPQFTRENNVKYIDFKKLLKDAEEWGASDYDVVYVDSWECISINGRDHKEIVLDLMDNPEYGSIFTRPSSIFNRL